MERSPSPQELDGGRSPENFAEQNQKADFFDINEQIAHEAKVLAEHKEKNKNFDALLRDKTVSEAAKQLVRRDRERTMEQIRRAEDTLIHLKLSKRDTLRKMEETFMKAPANEPVDRSAELPEITNPDYSDN